MRIAEEQDVIALVEEEIACRTIHFVEGKPQEGNTAASTAFCVVELTHGHLYADRFAPIFASWKKGTWQVG